MSSPKLVVVAGGTGAIGSEIVRRLTQSTPAFEVLVLYSRDSERAAKLRAETGCAIQRADAGDETQVEDVFASTPAPFAIVHAVGFAGDVLLSRQSRAGWDEVLRVHSDSVFLTTRAGLEKLQDGGRLIFIASRVGEIGHAGQTAYAASKAASIGLMKCAAREGAARRIAVNAICPGFIPSGMTESLNETQLKRAREASLWNEYGSAETVASLVQWLLSNEATGVSGQILHGDGRL